MVYATDRLYHRWCLIIKTAIEESFIRVLSASTRPSISIFSLASIGPFPGLVLAATAPVVPRRCRPVAGGSLLLGLRTEPGFQLSGSSSHGRLADSSRHRSS